MPDQPAPAVDRTILLSLADRGWVLMPLRGRRPLAGHGKGWSARTEPTTREEIEAWLDAGATGVGCVWGQSGLADVDADCPEASVLAAHLLPPTACRWERACDGGVRSHRVYRVGANARSELEEGICGLFAKGKQSRLPGSWHHAVGVLEWSDEGDPAEADPDELRAGVLTIKVGVAVGRVLRDGRGARHEIYLAAVGALAVAGWSLERVQQLSDAWIAAGWLDFTPNGLETTFERNVRAAPHTQWGRLAAYVGDEIAKVRRWACDVGGAAAELEEDERVVVDLHGRCDLSKDRDAVLEELHKIGGVWVGPAGLSTIRGGKLVALTRDTLLHEISARVHFRRLGAKGQRSCEPPRTLVGGLLEAERWPGLLEVDRVSDVPVLRADGSIARDPGYDAPTRTWVTAAAARAPAIGSTRQEALEAIQLLRSLVGETPFADGRARDAWVAGVLTECAGAALRSEPIPAWYIEANTQGAGKSTLAAMALAIGRGRRPAPVMMSERGAIDEKSLGAAVLDGAGIWLDNLLGKLADPTLAALITAGRASVRKYHTQVMVEGRLDGRAVWITTNGGTLGADYARRVVPVQLLITEGRAIDRQWSTRNPLAFVLENRATIHGCALTVLRAYLAAGAPQQRHGWYGFEAWADLVLGALAWLGVGGLGSLQSEVAAQYDEDGQATEVLLGAIESYLASTGQDAFRAREIADDRTGPTKIDKQQPREYLRNILRELGGTRAGQALSARRIGAILRDHGRPIGAKRVAVVRTTKGDRYWGLVVSRGGCEGPKQGVQGAQPPPQPPPQPPRAGNEGQ